MRTFKLPEAHWHMGNCTVNGFGSLWNVDSVKGQYLLYLVFVKGFSYELVP